MHYINLKLTYLLTYLLFNGLSSVVSQIVVNSTDVHFTLLLARDI